MAAAATTPLFNHTATTDSGTALEPVRMRCTACHGSGTPTTVTPACGVCGEQWCQTRFEAHLEAFDRGGWHARYSNIGMLWTPPPWLRWLTWLLPHARNGYRWDVALPCGHAMTAALVYVTTSCLACRGVGTVASWQLSTRYLRGMRLPSASQQQPPMMRHHYPPVAPIRSTPRLRPGVRRILWEERDTDAYATNPGNTISTNA